MAFGTDDAIQLGGEVVSQLLKAFNGPQKMNSFQNGGDYDPKKQLTHGMDRTTELFDALRGNLAKGVNLRSSYVQSPGSYAGGGLPMGIGVSGRDPALDNKSLLSLDGIGFGGEFGSGQRATHMGGPDGDGRTPSASAQPTGQFAVPRPAGSIPGQGAPQLKVGGGGEQAKAAFRMMGFNV